MNWDYCTHVPLLYEATRVTSGSVVELGAGLCSTPLLHALVTYGATPRELYTADDNVEWLSVLRSRFQTNKLHQFIHVVDWVLNLTPLASFKHSVVFIDAGKISDIPAAKKIRGQMIELFKDSEVLVIHDASNVMDLSADSDFDFEHVFVDTHTQPTTLWLSNSLAPEYVLTKRS